MSFFAGFVNGVFQGKDWREARDDRARRRKMEDQRWDWEKEDREHAIAGRGRQVGGWAEEDEAKAKAAAEKEEAEARAERIRQSQERAMAGPQSREMSAPPPAQGQPQNQPQERAAPPANQRGALSVLGLGELGTGATGRSMGETMPQGQPARRPVQVPLSMGEAVPQQQAAAPEAPPVQVAEALPPQGQPIPTDVQRVAAPRGFSLNNLIASPAAASTLPDDLQPRDPRGQATQDAIQGRGQGYSDYTEATRGFRSDAPRRGTEEQMVAAARAAQVDAGLVMREGTSGQAPQGQASSTPQRDLPVSDDHPFKAAIERDRARGDLSSAADIQNPQIGKRIALSVAGAVDSLQNPQVDPNSPEFQEFQRQNPQAAAAALEQSRAAQERQTQRQSERAAISGNSGQQGQTAPAGSPAPSRTLEQQAEQRERAAGAYSFNLGGAEMSISRANRKLTGTVADVAAEIAGAFDQSGQITGSMKAAGDAIAKNPALSAADALKDGTTPKQAEVKAMARNAAVRFQKEEVDRHARVLEGEGLFKEAAAWREYAQSENTRVAMEKLSEAMFYWNMNDEGRALQSIVELYNMNGYYDDGLSALSEGTAFRYENGQITGLTVTFRDEATGNVFSQEIRGPRDKIMAMVIGGLSPEATFAAALEAVGGVGAPAQQAPQMSVDERLKISKRIDERASLLAGPTGQVTPEMRTEAERQIMREMGMGSDNSDVPVWGG